MGNETGNWTKGKKGFQPTNHSSGKASPAAIAEELRSAQAAAHASHTTPRDNVNEIDTAYQAFTTLEKHDTSGQFDWHREPSDGTLILNNPHPDLDGYISVSLTDDGQYEAVVHEFEDPEANYEAEIDSRLFDTETEAQAWAQDWKYATLGNESYAEPFLPPVSEDKEGQGDDVFRQANSLTTMSGIVCNSCGKETPSREWDGEHLPDEDGVMRDYCSQCVLDQYDDSSSFFPTL